MCPFTPKGGESKPPIYSRWKVEKSLFLKNASSKLLIMKKKDDLGSGFIDSL
jgi:hypothetical protein